MDVFKSVENAMHEYNKNFKHSVEGQKIFDHQFNTKLWIPSLIKMHKHLHTVVKL